MNRCSWADGSDLMRRYHDEEWGTPTFDEGRLFEMLCLEGQQAGLSWETVLRKREGYRSAFSGFDPARVAGFSSEDIDRILQDRSVIRHRGKLESIVDNARAVVALEGRFADVVWSYVGGEPIVNRWQSLDELPAKTAESDAMSKGLKKLGFRFVGSTTCYAFMQACGMVDDHLATCFRKIG
ncbi:MAG TPA: DNA-3-methyladenine glycosylase I [Fimbriimonas sp.]